MARTKVKSTATSSTGTQWVALDSTPGTTLVTLINKSNTRISFRIVGTQDPGLPMDPLDAHAVNVMANSSEIEIKRTDNDNTPATLNYKCE